ncbi:hypothetical protein CC117_02480 [Parafrankia colletiae]|uniref:Uncharacterized protein n=1 Tax=Parafrankia colletiae TaxID=573497 RepID=A0A1S1R1P1_9ACTN|nr:hypothetical protein CC117_02480 [Parafrankia colletiae]
MASRVTGVRVSVDGVGEMAGVVGAGVGVCSCVGVGGGEVAVDVVVAPGLGVAVAVDVGPPGRRSRSPAATGDVIGAREAARIDSSRTEYRPTCS